MGFIAVAGVGLAVFACAVLLPEYAALTDLQARRDALAHQVECEGRLAEYNDRLARAMKTDPVLRERLLIRHANYRPAWSRTIEVPAAPDDPSARQRIMAKAMSPPAPTDNALVRAGRWLSDPITRGAVGVLSLGMIAAAMFLFAGRTSSARNDDDL